MNTTKPDVATSLDQDSRALRDATVKLRALEDEQMEMVTAAALSALSAVPPSAEVGLSQMAAITTAVELVLERKG